MSLFSEDDTKVMQFTPFTFEPPPIDYSQFEGVSSFPSSTQFYEESANAETFLKEDVFDKGKGRQAEAYEPNIKAQKQIIYLNPPLVYDLDYWSNSNQSTGVKFHPTRSEDFTCYVFGKEPNEKVKKEDYTLDTRVYNCSLANNIDSRRFYNETFSIFREASRATSSKEWREKSSRVKLLCDISWSYVNAIVKHINSLQERELNTFRDMMSIWELCRIMYFIKSERYQRLSTDLVTWLNECYPLGALTEEELNELRESPNLRNTVVFWSRLYKLILRGLFPQAINFLRSILIPVESDKFINREIVINDIIQSVIKCIKARPKISSHDTDLAWRNWLSQCSQLQKSIILENKFLEESFVKILKILAGDPDAILSKSSSWLEGLIALIYHKYPRCASSDIKAILGPIFVRFSVYPDATSQVLKRIFYQRIDDALGYCKYIDPWLLSHLMDLLYKVDLDEKIGEKSFRERCLINFAEPLLTHSTLWQIGFKYLEHCEIYGKVYIEEFIGKIPFDNERKFEKILKICEDNGLIFDEKCITTTMGTKYMQIKRYGSTMIYYMRAGKDENLKTICNMFLTQYVETGKITFEEVIDSIPVDKDSNESVNFLSRYRLYHSLIQDEFFHQAAQVLVECLRSEISPKEFWGVLLFHTVPLMKLGRRKDIKLFEKIHIDEFEHYCTQVLDRKIEDSWIKLVQRMKRWHYKECGYFNISEDLKPVKIEIERYKKFLSKLKR
ncbi:2659_t:CDS:10 [Funneliformis geosporum]|uniref:Nuclear pore complex protein Nup85 n=1 Tax=Funneliformis geosporum TaxID=1117311 RepID=A0A9W4SQI8_9GLOM|nr:2659_t:CDS:10 [Funneliformis geosporum]CAI2177619.1 12412_t:CDS:10 [Funneliformis geosporum]